jgi:hypothetical protein
MITITKTKEKTDDNKHIYNFERIKQNGYIKINNLFMDSDTQALKFAEKLNKNNPKDNFKIIEI